MTIHFIYTVPRSSSLIRRGIDKVISKIKFLPPLYRSGNDFFIPWRTPIRAPHSISYHLLHALKQCGRVKFYSLYEHTTCNVKEGDIVIGVPAQDHKDMPWKHPDYNTILYRTLEKYPNCISYIIMPYSNDPLFVGWATELIKKYGRRLILLSGKLWFDQWKEKSPWRHISIPHKVRTDMGIDAEDYPVVKMSFNPPGKRGMFYVGHTSWYKNIIELERIAEKMPGYEFGHIGGGTIKGWKKIADFADLSPEFMTEISKTYDIFVNVSADAQVTTVLEQMMLGMVVACTPESGYVAPSLIGLDMKNTDANVQTLLKIQNMPESELLKMCRANRAYGIKYHNWDQFCNTVITFMGLKRTRKE